MKYPKNIRLISKLKPNFMGFIFYKNSSRFFTNEQMPVINKSIKKVGVFVDAEINFISSMVRKHKLDHVQLHGNECPDYISKIKGVKIIKAFAIDKDFDFQKLNPFDSCDYFLFDTKGKMPGGNGISFDWKILRKYRLNKPFFLAGGIGFSNIKKIKNFFNSEISDNCYALDINSHFEIDKGKKDFQLIKKFINEL